MNRKHRLEVGMTVISDNILEKIMREELKNEDAYAPLIEFLENISAETIEENNVIGRYFAKKTKAEQAKMIIDKFIAFIEDEDLYEFPKGIYDVFADNISLLKNALEKGDYPQSLRKVYIEECIEKGENALKKISII